MQPDLAPHIERALGPGFRLTRELAGGAMSKVFVAEEIRLQREIVVKILAPELEAAVNAERFRAEVQRSAKLQHPHIVPVLATGVLALEGGRELPYYTMPFIPGESLRTLLARTGRLPIDDAVRLLEDVAEALAHAHERGIVHRDVKPANILISGSHAVVTDFGVSKALGAERRAGLTGTGMTLGTPGYMAPEQAGGDPDLDHRADLYSFGVVAYEALTGRFPFAGSTLQEVLAAQFRDEIEPLSRTRPELPVPLQRLVAGCLERSLERRVQRADQVVAELRGLRVASGPRAEHRRSRRSVAIAAAATALVLAGGALAVKAILDRSAAPTPITVAVARPTAPPTLAVVPADLFGAGQTPEAGQLLDHLAEDISRDLARVDGIQVKANLSVLALMHRAPSLTPREVGDSLRVAHVLTFVARPAATGLSLTAQLIETGPETEVWAQEYHASTDSVDLARIRQDVVKALGSRLLGESTSVSMASDVWRPDAAEAAYRDGRLSLQRRTRAGLLAAVDRFEETLRLDSTHVAAAANLGNALALLLAYGYRVVPGDNYQTAARALAMAERAIRLAPSEPRGYIIRGYLTNLLLGPPARVHLDYRRARELETTDTDFDSWNSLLLLRDNHNDLAIEMARRAVEVDPQSPGRHLALALALLQARHYAEADTAAARTLTLQPDLRRARQVQAVAMLMSRHPDECLARDPWPYVGVRAACLEASGAERAARRLVDSLEQVVTQRKARSTEYDDVIPTAELAAYHAWKGSATEALAYTRLAFERSPIGIDPRVLRSGMFDAALRNPDFAAELQILQDAVWPRVLELAAKLDSAAAATAAPPSPS